MLLHRKYTVGLNYLLLGGARKLRNKFRVEFSIKHRGTQSMHFFWYVFTGETTTVPEPNHHLTSALSLASLPLLKEQWRPCRPNFSQSRCAGSSWRKAEWSGTGTLLGPQTNTWPQKKSRKVIFKLGPGSGAAVPTTPYKPLQSALLWAEAIKCVSIDLKVIIVITL